MMIRRDLEQKILHSLETFPAVALLGARQVGKTTLAKIAMNAAAPGRSIYLDLEYPPDYEILHKNAELFLKQNEDRLVVLDEIQRVPELFPLLRALIDQRRTPARFLILGSAAPNLLRQSSESLAGRIAYHELTPFTLQELPEPAQNWFNLWLRGGFPDSYLARDLETSAFWRSQFIKTYLERDLPQLGIQIAASRLHAFWTMVAHTHGKLWNGSDLARSLGISVPAASRYLDILQDTFVVRRLLPYHPNLKKRLVKSPKIYIRDSGLLHSLLDIRDMETLQRHPAAGASWEGFVLEQVIQKALAQNYTPYFYRTRAGAEVDLVLCRANEPPLVFEVKYSLTPKPTKGFWQSIEDLQASSAYVVYPGERSYPLSDMAKALPIGDVLKLL